MYTISGIMLDTKKKEEMKGGERITVLGSLHTMEVISSICSPAKGPRKALSYVQRGGGFFLKVVHWRI